MSELRLFTVRLWQFEDKLLKRVHLSVCQVYLKSDTVRVAYNVTNRISTFSPSLYYVNSDRKEIQVELLMDKYVFRSSETKKLEI